MSVADTAATAGVSTSIDIVVRALTDLGIGTILVMLLGVMTTQTVRGCPLAQVGALTDTYAWPLSAPTEDLTMHWIFAEVVPGAVATEVLDDRAPGRLAGALTCVVRVVEDQSIVDDPEDEKQQDGHHQGELHRGRAPGAAALPPERLLAHERLAPPRSSPRCVPCRRGPSKAGPYEPG